MPTKRSNNGCAWRKIAAGAICVIYMSVLAGDARPEGEVRNLKDFLYWDSGKARQCTIYDAGTGRLKGKIYCTNEGVIEKAEKFDEYGNKTEEAIYDARGNLKTGIDGWAAMRWRYDGPHLVWQASYDESGRPIERKLYSESGKLVMRLYRDDDSVNPYVNAAMYMMLGGANIAYYDPREGFVDASRAMTE